MEVFTIEYLEKYLADRHIEVKRNAITHQIEILGVDDKNPAVLNKFFTVLIYSDLRPDVQGLSERRIRSYLDIIASKNVYNPILEKIQSVKWDGVDRLEEVYNIFGIDKADTLSRVLMKKWFMQCVCGLYNTDTDNPYNLDIFLVFQGKREVGKARFFEHLAMQHSFFGDTVMNAPTNKDAYRKATSCWICELDKIKNVDKLKEFLKLSYDTYHDGCTTLEYNRKTSFFCTIKDKKQLIDKTEDNRLFAIIPLKSDLRIDYSTQIERFNSLQFWAQIYNRIEYEIVLTRKSSESVFRLTREELTQLNERNRKKVMKNGRKSKKTS